MSTEGPATFTTRGRFDARSVPAYQGSHEAVYRHIRDHQEEHVAQLQRWLRQPSISAQNVGVREMAELLRDDLLGLGFREAELVPTDGHPGVFGFYDAGAPRTLLVEMANPPAISGPPPLRPGRAGAAPGHATLGTIPVGIVAREVTPAPALGLDGGKRLRITLALAGGVLAVGILLL